MTRRTSWMPIGSASLALLAGLVMLALPAGSPLAAARDGCYTSWSEASPVVAAEQLVAVADLSTMARRRLDGDIVRTVLCVENGRYVYKVMVRSANGATRPLTLDARQPFAPK